MEIVIPIHDFWEEDVRSTQIRYIALPQRSDYDDAHPHRHNYFEIFFFEKGGGSHLIDFKDYPVANHSIHVVYPGQVHMLHRHPDSYGCVVHFSQEIYHAVEGIDAILNQAIVEIALSDTEYNELQIILHILKYEYDRRKVNHNILKGCLQLLLLRCTEFSNSDTFGKSPAFPEPFMRFRQLVESQFRIHKSPTWYARQLDLEDWNLNNLCHASVGTAPGDYIKNRILLEAKRLLYNSQLTVKEISYYLGFEDPSYFNRFFKKREGISAGDFRQQTLGNNNTG